MAAILGGKLFGGIVLLASAALMVTLTILIINHVYIVPYLKALEMKVEVLVMFQNVVEIATAYSSPRENICSRIFSIYHIDILIHKIIPVVVCRSYGWMLMQSQVCNRHSLKA